MQAASPIRHTPGRTSGRDQAGVVHVEASRPACLALPQPLRWFMGRWARQMNHSLAQLLIEQVRRSVHWHPETTATAGMAEDGIHPSTEGYAAWADGLSRRILASQAPGQSWLSG